MVKSTYQILKEIRDLIRAVILMLLAIMIFLILGCTKPPDTPVDCDCATITRGYEPMEWYKLEWCNGDTARIWVVSEAWQIKDTDCLTELQEIELDTCKTK